MTLLALIGGVVVGYGLALLREHLRVRSCEQDCTTLRTVLRQRQEQDTELAALFGTAERMARELVKVQSAQSRHDS